MTYPTPALVRAALSGPNGEVLKLIALQPLRAPKDMRSDPPMVPVPGR